MTAGAGRSPNRVIPAAYSAAGTRPNAQPQVRARAAGEPACRPGSVHQPKLAGGHPSRAAVAGSLVRSTRELRAGRPQTLAQAPRPGSRRALVTLLQVGFTK